MNHIETTTYVRNPFYVEVIKITEQNMADVAEWCGGKVVEAGFGKYIDVFIQNPLTPRQKQGRVGDYLLYAENGFKVYIPRAFEKSFSKHGDKTTSYEKPIVITKKAPKPAENPKGRIRRPAKVVESGEKSSKVVEGTGLRSDPYRIGIFPEPS